jgi:hypothetical protein
VQRGRRSGSFHLCLRFFSRRGTNIHHYFKFWSTHCRTRFSAMLQSRMRTSHSCLSAANSNTCQAPVVVGREHPGIPDLPASCTTPRLHRPIAPPPYHDETKQGWISKLVHNPKNRYPDFIETHTGSMYMTQGRNFVDCSILLVFILISRNGQILTNVSNCCDGCFT